MQSSRQFSRSPCGINTQTVHLSVHKMLPAHRSKSSKLSVNSIASAERMLKAVSAEALNDQEIKKLLQRPRIDFSSILGTVRMAPTSLGRAAAATVTAAMVVAYSSWHGVPFMQAAYAGPSCMTCAVTAWQCSACNQNWDGASNVMLCVGYVGGPDCGSGQAGRRCSSKAIH
jgi:hypothetical protein